MDPSTLSAGTDQGRNSCPGLGILVRWATSAFAQIALLRAELPADIDSQIVYTAGNLKLHTCKGPRARPHLRREKNTPPTFSCD